MNLKYLNPLWLFGVVIGFLMAGFVKIVFSIIEGFFAGARQVMDR